jgi:hypothetical protein
VLAEALVLTQPGTRAPPLPSLVGGRVTARNVIVAVTGLVKAILDADPHGDMLREDATLHPEVLLGFVQARQL